VLTKEKASNKETDFSVSLSITSRSKYQGFRKSLSIDQFLMQTGTFFGNNLFICAVPKNISLAKGLVRPLRSSNLGFAQE